MESKPKDRRPSRRRRIVAIGVVALASVLAVAPTAHAAETQYANQKAAKQRQILTHASPATIKGGRAYGGSTLVTFNVSTVVGAGYLVAYASAKGTTVYLSHPLSYGSYSNCSWDYASNLGSGTIPMNCWRS